MCLKKGVYDYNEGPSIYQSRNSRGADWDWNPLNLTLPSDFDPSGTMFFITIVKSRMGLTMKFYGEEDLLGP